MNPIFEEQLLQTRRQFFGSTGLRLGGMTLAGMLGQMRLAMLRKLRLSEFILRWLAIRTLRPRPRR